MAAAERILPHVRSNILSRRHCASFLRPPNTLSTAFGLPLTDRRSCCVLSPRLTSLIAYHSPSLRRSFSSATRTSSAAPTYSYSISAAYSDKKHPLNPSRNTYTYNPFHRVTKTASEITSKERKAARPQSGQDAFFVSNVNGTGSVAFGVIDGVGGWETSGVDPADFAHGLGDYMASAAAWWPEGFQDTTNVAKPTELLDIGYQRVMKDKSIAAGGSTACLATASPDGLLETAK
jgi:protein phosphatase PTC7